MTDQRDSMTDSGGGIGNDCDQFIVQDHAYSCEVELEGTKEQICDVKCDSVKDCSQPGLVLVKKANSSSVIWTYFGFTADRNGFPIDNGRPICRTCEKAVSCKFGNTSNLFKHLKDHHPALYGKAQV